MMDTVAIDGGPLKKIHQRMLKHQQSSISCQFDSRPLKKIHQRMLKQYLTDMRPVDFLTAQKDSPENAETPIGSHASRTVSGTNQKDSPENAETLNKAKST